MADIIVGLYENWLWLDERIESLSSEIEKISKTESNCSRLMSVPGIGPMISTAMVAAIGTGEAFERGRDFGAWLGLVPRQFSTGGKPILNSERWRMKCSACGSRAVETKPELYPGGIEAMRRRRREI
jgi:transposase